MFGPFDSLFDFDGDGVLNVFERAAQLEFLESNSREFDEDDDDDKNDEYDDDDEYDEDDEDGEDEDDFF